MLLPLFLIGATGALWWLAKGRHPYHQLPAAASGLVKGTAGSLFDASDVEAALAGLGFDVLDIRGARDIRFEDWAWEADVNGVANRALPQTARFLRAGTLVDAVRINSYTPR